MIDEPIANILFHYIRRRNSTVISPQLRRSPTNTKSNALLSHFTLCEIQFWGLKISPCGTQFQLRETEVRLGLEWNGK